MTLCWGEPREHSHTERLLTGVLSAWKLLSCSLIFLLRSCQSLWRKPVILSHSWSSSALLAMWKVHFGNLILSTLRKKFLFWGTANTLVSPTTKIMQENGRFSSHYQVPAPCETCSFQFLFSRMQWEAKADFFFSNFYLFCELLDVFLIPWTKGQKYQIVALPPR